MTHIRITNEQGFQLAHREFNLGEYVSLNVRTPVILDVPARPAVVKRGRVLVPAEPASVRWHTLDLRLDLTPSGSGHTPLRHVRGELHELRRELAELQRALVAEYGDSDPTMTRVQRPLRSLALLADRLAELAR